MPENDWSWLQKHIGPRFFQIRISGPKISSAPTETDLPCNVCFRYIFSSFTVAAVGALQTLFRAPLTPGVHPGGRNIAYDLALVKLGPHDKFGEDWTNCVDFYTGHTNTQKHKHRLTFIYKRQLNNYNNYELYARGNCFHLNM